MIEAPASTLAPWEAEPRQLWSLLDMLRFYAFSFTATIANIERAVAKILVDRLAEHSGVGDLDLGTAAEVHKALRDLTEALDELPVSSTLQAQIRRARAQIEESGVSEEPGISVALTLLNEIKLNVVNELSAHLCLMVPDARRSYYTQKKPLFGETVAARFPDGARDIAAAGRCIALDEWTAAVFHLMRVVEHGLRDLADRVGATFPAPIELQQWKNIIDAIEARIRLIEQQPKSLDKTADLKFYGAAASQFWHFKEAWRNHVSHSREHYDEREAIQVFNGVRDFMQKLAERS